MMQLELAGLHEAIAAAKGDAECLVAGNTRRTWAEVTDRSRRIADVLRRAGLGRRAGTGAVEPWASANDHLGLLLYNGPEYLETLLGAHKARVAPFNINYRYTPDELAEILADATPGALVFHAALAPTVDAALTKLPRPGVLLQVADGSGIGLIDGAVDFERALAAAEPAQLVPAPSPDDVHLLYTGGTTGRPKGVIWRIGDLVAGPLGVRDREGNPLSLTEALRRADAESGPVLPAPPLMHGAGTWFALGGWLTGATIVIQEQTQRFDPAELLDTCARERAASLMIVGDAFATPLIAELDSDRRDLSALRSIVNSGAPLRPELKARLEDLTGARVLDTLGSSETGQQATRAGSSATQRFKARGDVAVMNSERSARLPAGSDDIGWLAQSGPIPTGYLNDREKTDQTFVEVAGRRWAVPGDRARLLADGSIELLGRDATTINTGGEKVFAEEVEAVLRRVPCVADAVVLGRPSPRWGQEIVAVLALHRHDDPVTDSELRDQAARQLARYKLPKVIVRVEQVRRHPNGKPDYRWAKRLVDTAGGPA
jgi:acyl-CoA synthetase (AMP-forming)/AMP-acid ligase II